ncbi:uncharacterized protein [Parasteatoda tepidariorum]|uniref:uncharacterized protein n=1 Tax=Parasteatoda tepidariorum TaxID=114398 RepID=UPI001C71A8E8|nr:uncharacterized protein LOC107456470 [Parasteatoda tepidariorum]
MELHLKEPIKRSLTNITRGDFSEIWEVDTPEKNNLIWSVMTPYLLSSAEIGNFETSMQLLIGDGDEVQRLMDSINLREKLNPTVIQNLVRRKNPLVDQHSLYIENDVRNLMRLFKKRLDFLTNDLSRTTGNKFNDFLRLQAAANSIECQIDLFDENNVLFKSFFPDNLTEKLVEKEGVILFVHLVSGTNIFRYGLRSDYALHSRNKHLKGILKLAKIPPDKIDTLFNPHPSEQLLLQILQSAEREIVHNIYESAFILEKLSSAGYDMSPESKDNEGFSAFHHCLKSDDWALFLKLYNYPTKSMHFSSIYDDDHHWKVLESFEVTITNDYMNLKKDLYEKLVFCTEDSISILLSYEQILHFITLHKNFLKKMSYIMRNSTSSNSDKAKNLLTLLINEYNSHFYFRSNRWDEFEEYFSCYAYHKILDDYISLCFTDFFMSLGNIVDVNNEKSLEDALINLLKYFSSKVYCGKLGFRTRDYKPEEKTIFFAIFCYRVEWKSSLDVLLQTLQSSFADKGKNTTQLIFETCMKKFPLLKEDYEIMNLKMHFKMADSADFSKDSLKSAFIVERALHIIGETICSVTDGCMITPLLSYCLSPDLERAFCDMRNNCLAHYKASSVKGREAIEKGSYLNNIQPELNILSDKLNPIFKLQSFRVKQEILEKCMKEYHNTPTKLQPQRVEVLRRLMKIEIKILRSRKNIYSSYKNEYVSLLYKILKCILQELKTKKVSELRMRFEHFKYLLSYDEKKVKVWDIFDILSQLHMQMYAIFEKNDIKTDITQDMSNEILNTFKNVEEKFDSHVSDLALDYFNEDEFSILKSITCNIVMSSYSSIEIEKLMKELSVFYMRNSKSIKIMTRGLYQNFKSTFQELKNKKITKVEELQKRFKYFEPIVNDCTKKRKIFDILSQLVAQVDAILERNTAGIVTDISQDRTNDILNIFNQVEEILNSHLSAVTKEFENKNEFVNLKDLFNKIEKYEYFSPIEAEKIRDEFSDILKTPFESRQILIDHLNNKNPLTTEEINTHVETLFVPKTLREKIRKSLIRDPPKALLMIRDIKDNVETILGKKEDTSYKFMKIFLDDMFIKKIKLLNLPLFLHEKIRNLHSQKLDFAIERLQYMKQVLTKDDHSLCKWLDNEKKTLKEENYTKQLMVQRYANEIDTKAALETLLLDYLNIINCNKEFYEMKRKSSSLFCGINLRNILSHQSPVVEISNMVLDDKNLANEFMNKIYMYLEDLKPLVALSDFYKVMRCPKKKKFEALIKDEKTQDAYSLFRNTIKSCDKWKLYLLLLPEE